MQITLTEALAAEFLREAEEFANDADLVEFHTGVRPCDRRTRLADALLDAVRTTEWKNSIECAEEDDDALAELGQANFWYDEMQKATEDEPPSQAELDEIKARLRNLPPPAPAGTVMEDGFVMPF